MTDPRTELQAIRDRAKAATQGPLIRYSRDFRGHRSHSVKSVGSGAVRAHTGYGPDGGSAYADAELFAHARTDVPRLVDALTAVLQLHERQGIYELCIAPTCDGEDHDHFETQDGDMVHGDVLEYWSCSTCLDDDDAIEWPCSTVQAITDAMGGDDD